MEAVKVYVTDAVYCRTLVDVMTAQYPGHAYPIPVYKLPFNGMLVEVEAEIIEDMPLPHGDPKDGHFIWRNVLYKYRDGMDENDDDDDDDDDDEEDDEDDDDEEEDDENDDEEDDEDDDDEEEEEQQTVKLIPDIVFYYGLEEFPAYDESRLRNYLVGFHQKVMPLLPGLEADSVKYIEENLGLVIDYLVSKLSSYRFYKHPRSDPDKGGSIVFADFSDPQKPIFTGLAFGAKAIYGPYGYTPWKPSDVMPWTKPEADNHH